MYNFKLREGRIFVSSSILYPADTIITLCVQEEYLHQTYNSMPDMTQKLNMIIMDPNIQWNIYNDSRAEVTRNKPTMPNITKVQ